MNTQNPTTKRPLTMDFNEILTKLKAHPGDPSITITSNAAHTYMDAGLTREHLKKLGREAEQLVLQHYDKRTATPVIERTRGLLADMKMVDHLPGMAIFVNKEIAELVHLPFTLEERVTVGSSFFTRSLLRAGLDSIHYHVLLLSSGHARLFEANDRHVVGELRGAFPLENRHYTTDASQITNAKGQDSQDRRYYQEVDQAVRHAVGQDGLVIVASVADHFAHFMKAVEGTGIYLGNLKGNFDHISEQEMVSKAWEIAHVEQGRRHLHELEHAADGTPTKFSTSVTDIWSLVSDGRGQVLFVERDKHQAAVPHEDHMVLVEEGADHQPGIDLVDAIIEEHLGHGGEVRILPNGSMAKYGGIALKMRY